MKRRYRPGRRQLFQALAILAVAASGVMLLSMSKAATLTIPEEAEQGKLTGAAAQVSESGASGGAAVKFAGTSSNRPVALVYRGPAGCSGCSESLAAMLQQSSYNFDVKYIGPNETLKLTAASLQGATLYAQPGGNGTVDDAVNAIGNAGLQLIKDFVQNGGHYLGFCMGAYLAGSNPGMGMLAPGDTDGYIDQADAVVKTDADSVVPVVWRGVNRIHFFQDGAIIIPSKVSGEHIIATYSTGEVDALTKPYGKGRIGLSGTHPEATRDWYTASLWAKDTDGLDTANALDLVNDLMSP